MDVKLFEIRDRATFIPVMAIALIERNAAENYLLRRAGYAAEQIANAADPVDGRVFEDGCERYVILCKLDGVEAQYDVFEWPGKSRTMPAAHQHIIEKWSTLTSGDVIDVQVILGETTEPKVSERLAHPLV